MAAHQAACIEAYRPSGAMFAWSGVNRRKNRPFGRDGHLHVSDVEVVSADAAFLEQVRDVVEAHLADENFGVEELAADLAISRGHLHRRLPEPASEIPTDVVRRLRLERAAQLLAERAGSVSEIAYGVGFKVSHISRSAFANATA